MCVGMRRGHDPSSGDTGSSHTGKKSLSTADRPRSGAAVEVSFDDV